MPDIMMDLMGTMLPAPEYATKEYVQARIAEAMNTAGSGPSVVLEPATFTANGSYQPDPGKAWDDVTVNVANSYSAADEGKVVSGGSLVAQTAHATVTSNGVVDTTLNNSVEVAVAAGGMELTTVVDYTASAAVSEILIDSGLGNYEYYEISLFGNTSAAEWIYPIFVPGSTVKDMYINGPGGAAGTSVWNGIKMTVTKNISGIDSLYTTTLHKTQFAFAAKVGQSFSYLRLVLYYSTSTFQSGFRVLIKGGNFS